MLATAEEICARARRVLATHAGVAGGVAGGVVVMALADTIAPHAFAHDDELLGVGFGTTTSTAILSALVVERALRTPADAASRTFAGSVLAAIANVTLACWLTGLGFVVVRRLEGEAPNLGSLLLGAVAGLFAAVPGLVVSLPLGVCFGLMFASCTRVVGRELTRPTASSIVRAYRVGATLLGGVAIGAFVLAFVRWGAPAAIVTAAPPVVLAVGSALFAASESKRLFDLAEVLRRDAHVSLALCDRSLAVLGDDVVPLDASGDTRAIVARSALASAYRGKPPALGFLG